MNFRCLSRFGAWAFGPGGKVIAICARSRSRETYQIAARIAEYLIITGFEEASREEGERHAA